MAHDKQHAVRTSAVVDGLAARSTADPLIRHHTDGDADRSCKEAQHK